MRPGPRHRVCRVGVAPPRVVDRRRVGRQRRDVRWWFGARARALGRVARRRIVSDLPVEKVLFSRPRVEGEAGPKSQLEKPWLGFFLADVRISYFVFVSNRFALCETRKQSAKRRLTCGLFERGSLADSKISRPSKWTRAWPLYLKRRASLPSRPLRSGGWYRPAPADGWSVVDKVRILTLPGSRRTRNPPKPHPRRVTTRASFARN